MDLFHSSLIIMHRNDLTWEAAACGLTSSKASWQLLTVDRAPLNEPCRV